MPRPFDPDDIYRREYERESARQQARLEARLDFRRRAADRSAKETAFGCLIVFVGLPLLVCGGCLSLPAFFGPRPNNARNGAEQVGPARPVRPPAPNPERPGAPPKLDKAVFGFDAGERVVVVSPDGRDAPAGREWKHLSRVCDVIEAGRDPTGHEFVREGQTVFLKPGTEATVQMGWRGFAVPVVVTAGPHAGPEKFWVEKKRLHTAPADVPKPEAQPTTPPPEQPPVAVLEDQARGVRVVVASARLGRVTFERDGRRHTPTDVFLKIDLAVYGSPEGAGNKLALSPRLTDSYGRSVEWVAWDAIHGRPADTAEAVTAPPSGRVSATLVFAAPRSGAGDLTLELPGEPVEPGKVFKFVIPSGTW